MSYCVKFTHRYVLGGEKKEQDDDEKDEDQKDKKKTRRKAKGVVKRILWMVQAPTPKRHRLKILKNV